LKPELRVSEEAAVEMAEAARWYERHRRGLGGEFLAEIDKALVRLEGSPRTGTPVPGIEDTDVRRLFVRRFPYHVVYIELPDRLQILAVAHDRRRPRYWVGRLPG
jgi:toxin ParE1/3/4